jgi:hypothetical protein
MPIYIFKHPKKEEYVEVVQAMRDEHTHVDEKGVKWERVYTLPNTSIDSKIDPHSPKDFLEKTRNKRGTIGEMMDYSRELSERRGGEINDPIVRKRNAEYKKQMGIEHSSEKKIRAKEKLKKLGITVEK